MGSKSFQQTIKLSTFLFLQINLVVKRPNHLPLYKKTKTKTKTKTKNEKDPTCAIFSESRGCKVIKYDLSPRMSNVKC